MAFLKVHRVKTKNKFVKRGEMHISDEHIQNLNRKIQEDVQRKNDEQTRIIDETNLLNKRFK